jgi:deoxyribodipyrimidine photo-lyase
MKLHWVHIDCLDTGWIDPAAGPAVFVFDDAESWSLKRVGFVYECLLEMPGVEIWRGPAAETLAMLARARGVESVLSVWTPDPWLQARAGELEARDITVEWLTPEPFVALSGAVDLRRFSRYWRKAEPALFPD